MNDSTIEYPIKTIVLCNRNGNVLHKYRVINNKKYGLYESFYLNGKRKETCYYIDD